LQVAAKLGAESVVLLIPESVADLAPARVVVAPRTVHLGCSGSADLVWAAGASFVLLPVSFERSHLAAALRC
jgi:hypothetical protein